MENPPLACKENLHTHTYIYIYSQSDSVANRISKTIYYPRRKGAQDVMMVVVEEEGEWETP